MMAGGIARRHFAVVAYLVAWISAVVSPSFALDAVQNDGKFVFERLCPEKNASNNGDQNAKGETFDRYRICRDLMLAPGKGAVDDVAFLRSRVNDLMGNTAVASERAAARVQWFGGLTALIGVGAAAMAFFKKEIFTRIRTFLLALSVIVPPFVISSGWKSQWQAELAAHQSLVVLRDRIDMALVARAATGEAICEKTVAAWLDKFEAALASYSTTMAGGSTVFAPAPVIGSGENQRATEEQQHDPTGRGGNPPGSGIAG